MHSLRRFTRSRPRRCPLAGSGSTSTRSRSPAMSPPAAAAVYLRSVRQFLDWLDVEHPGVTDVAGVTRHHVDGWLASLAEAGRSPATRSVRLKALSRFFDYVLADEDSAVNPCTKVARPRVEVPLVEVPTDAAVRALLKACDGRVLSTAVTRRWSVCSPTRGCAVEEAVSPGPRRRGPDRARPSWSARARAAAPGGRDRRQDRPGDLQVAAHPPHLAADRGSRSVPGQPRRAAHRRRCVPHPRAALRDRRP